MNIEQQAAFEAWTLGVYSLHKNESGEYLSMVTHIAWEAYQAGRAALQSPEVQALRDALDQCRFALEPYDDIKPRDWVTDRERLRRAHEVARTALAAMEKQHD